MKKYPLPETKEENYSPGEPRKILHLIKKIQEKINNQGSCLIFVYQKPAFSVFKLFRPY